MKNNPRHLLYQKLDIATFKIKVYADASFANNPDYSSQLGYIVLLTDDTNKAHVITYASYKSRRVTRSVLGAEA